jgi:DnaJ-class molecular chaperone
MKCPRCKGRGRVAKWHSWTPRKSGMRWRYETTAPCDTCYGSGIDLGDESAWGKVASAVVPAIYEVRRA